MNPRRRDWERRDWEREEREGRPYGQPRYERSSYPESYGGPYERERFGRDPYESQREAQRGGYRGGEGWGPYERGESREGFGYREPWYGGEGGEGFGEGYSSGLGHEGYGSRGYGGYGTHGESRWERERPYSQYGGKGRGEWQGRGDWDYEIDRPERRDSPGSRGHASSGTSGWGGSSGSSGYGRSGYGQSGSYGQSGGYAQSGGYGQSSYGRGGMGFRGEESSGMSGSEGYRGTETMRSRGPHAGRGPKNYRRSDERTKEEVSERLAMDDEIDASEIEIEVRDGIVTLSGTVNSRREKRLAEDCAEDVFGVKDVTNQIRVQKEGSNESGDAPATRSREIAGSKSTPTPSTQTSQATRTGT